ncbi:MAG: hypothetical protein H6608_12030 [Flavobacteriales bacterium]|nr:hypothetical protein [Bacteroidota bacterium]MCB9241858.1 hypothetical protein [Flavobacteriales bacterium]
MNRLATTILVLTLMASVPVYASSTHRNKDGEVAQGNDQSSQRAWELFHEAQALKSSDKKAAFAKLDECIAIAKTLNDGGILFQAYYAMGEMHREKRSLLQPKAAIQAYEEAAKYATNIGDKNGILASYKRLAEEYAFLKMTNQALDYYRKYTEIEEQNIQRKVKQLADNLEQTSKSLEQTSNSLTATNQTLQQTKHDVEVKDEQISGLVEDNQAAVATIDSMSETQMKAQLKIQEQELENQQIKLDLSEEKNKRNILLGTVIGIVLVLTFLFLAFMQNKRSNRKLAEKNKVIEEEREKSDELLLNILPKPVASELKERGQTTPHHYDNVTVLFTDFQSFTTIAEGMTPIELVNEINYYFRAFDRIISRYNIEKIKTIGDAYMCVSGLPEPNPDHCSEVLKAAIEMRDFVIKEEEERARDKRPAFKMRMGIHSGSLVAGVVGSTKFIYDVWGDTVNTAARMEQNGEVEKINVSEEVYKLARLQFNFTSRGSIQAKNKGQLNMYFLDGVKKMEVEQIA